MRNNLQPDFFDEEVNAYHQKTQQSCQQTTRQILLNNQIISMPEYSLQKSLSSRAQQLRSNLDCLRMQAANHRCAANVSLLFQQIIMIFIAYGNMRYAREIAYSTIQGWIEWSHKAKNIDILKYVFQAWVDLIKIDRLEGNSYDAFEKLNVLQFMQHPVSMHGENRDLLELLCVALDSDMEIKKAIYQQSTIERIRLMLDTRQYDELNKFMDDRLRIVELPNPVFCQEARIIALANTGNANDVLHFLVNTIKLNFEQISQPVLQLRLCEIHLYLEHSISSIHFAYLQRLMMCIINSVACQAHDIRVAMHAARIMHAAGLFGEAIKLGYFCLHVSTQIQDDLLKAESLLLLYDILPDFEDRRTMEDLMIVHYFETQFHLARQKMLACFPDLKYVEGNSNQDQLTRLFEDCLAFNMSS